MNENARDGKLWISVKDMQPEQDGRFLVTRYDYVTKSSFLDILWFEKNGWWNRHFKGNYTVTHWMPLPDLPNEKKWSDNYVCN